MASTSESRRGFWEELVAYEQAVLSALGCRSRFRPGNVILTEHDDTNHVVVIRSGLTKVSLGSGARREVLLALRGSGDIVGEMSYVSGRPRSATVTALDHVEALMVEGRAFGRFLRQFPHVSTILLRVLVARLRHCDRCRASTGGTSVAQRLARLLLQLDERYGVPTGGGTRLALALSQDDLAAFVGASQRAVARELESWRQRGIIDTGRRWVIIRRPEDLRRIAGSSDTVP